MKTFAEQNNPIDIEELYKLRCLNDNMHICKGSSKRTIHLIQSDDSCEWFTPPDMDSLYKLLVQHQTSAYKLVSGNTGTGVFKNDGPYKVKFEYYKRI